MAKRPVAYECPPGAVKDVLGTCTDFNPSYDVRRLEVKHRAELRSKLLKHVHDLNLEPLGKYTLKTPLSEIFKGRESVALPELQKAMRKAGKPPGEGVDLSLLLRQGVLGDLLSGVAPEAVYKAQIKLCEKLVGDEDKFRAEGCKRRGHILLPAGRWSFENLGKPAPGTKKAKAARASRLKGDNPPFEARTQSLLNREAARPFAERFESLVNAIEDGLSAYAKGAGKERPEIFELPPVPGPLVASGVPAAAADYIMSKAGGKRVRFQSKKRSFSIEEGLSAILGGVSFRFARDWKTSLQNTPRFSVVTSCKTCGGTGEVEFVRKEEVYVKRCPTCRGDQNQPIDLRRVRGGGKEALPLFRNLARLRGENWLYLRGLTLVQPDGTRTALPIDFESWPDETDTTLRSARVGSKILARLGTNLKLFDERGRPAPSEQVVELQHSELLSAAAPLRPTDYSALEQFPVSELARIVARKLLSPRKKKTGRRDRPFNPDSAKNNPLATYTLTSTDLQGPAYLFRPPVAGDVPVSDGLGHTVAVHQGAMGPGMYKLYSPGKYIFWGTKKDASPKVVSAERLQTWLTVAEKGASISQRSKGSNYATQNPQKSRYVQRGSDLSTLHLASRENNMSVNNYYPGSIWSFYEDGAFGPGAPTPVNRRNPRAEVKLTKKGVPRKPPTAGQIAWRKQFGQMMKKVETKALLSRSVKASNMGQHLRAAWAEIYPISKRKPKHHADIENHVKQVVANNNPNASFVDYPRATLYSEVQGQYGFDPRFGNVPPNRRNPKGAAGQMEARFPGKCGLCGGEYDRGDAIAIVEGAAGPRGGKVRKHAGC